MMLKNFSSSSWRHCSSVVSRNVRKRPWPALFTRASTPPSAAAAPATQAFTCSGWSTSQTWAKTRAPGRARSSAAAASRRAAPRAQIATRAPSSRKARAVASPMPALPPVIRATLSRSPRSIVLRASASTPPELDCGELAVANTRRIIPDDRLADRDRLLLPEHQAPPHRAEHQVEHEPDQGDHRDAGEDLAAGEGGRGEGDQVAQPLRGADHLGEDGDDQGDRQGDAQAREDVG